jgi:hypothetical protein
MGWDSNGGMKSKARTRGVMREEGQNGWEAVQVRDGEAVRGEGSEGGQTVAGEGVDVGADVVVGRRRVEDEVHLACPPNPPAVSTATVPPPILTRARVACSSLLLPRTVQVPTPLAFLCQPFEACAFGSSDSDAIQWVGGVEASRGSEEVAHRRRQPFRRRLWS